MQYSPETRPQEKKKVEKIVSGNVKTRKKSEFKKISEIFISDDIHNVKSFVLLEVLVPTIKKAIADIVKNGIDMALYGESDRSRSSGNSKPSYRSSFKTSEGRSRASVRTFDYDEIVFDSRGEAEEVLDTLDEMIDEYRFVSIADYYDLCGFDAPHTYNKYGWTNLRSAAIHRVRDGYVIHFPKALPID